MRAVEDKVTERESELISKQSNVLSECSGRLETVQQKWSENSIRDSVCDPLKDGPLENNRVGPLQKRHAPFQKRTNNFQL